MEFTQSRGSLKVQCKSLMEAELRMQEAKELTKELLGHHHNDWASLVVDEHRKRGELDKRQIQMMTLIASFEESIAPQQQGECGAARSAADHLMFEKLKLHTRTEAAKMESGMDNVDEMEADPAEDAAAAPDKMLRDPGIEEPALDSVPPDEMLRTSTNYYES